MGVITLNVVSQEKGTKKTMQFDPTTLVFDVCKVIREKLHMNVDRESIHHFWGVFRGWKCLTEVTLVQLLLSMGRR